MGLKELGELRFMQVRRTPMERLFNGLIAQHHYLGYTQPVGEHLKYLVYAGQRPIACFAWSSAARHLGPAGSVYWLVGAGASAQYSAFGV